MSARKADKKEPQSLVEEEVLDADVEDEDEDIDVDDLETVDVDAVLPVPDDEKDDDASEDPEGAEDASLDEILADRSVPKKGAAPDELDDDEVDIMALATDRDIAAVVGPLPERVDPVKDTQEFVCSNCHLVKAKSQLADAARGLCRDCV